MEWFDVESSQPEGMTTVLVCLSLDVVTIGFLCDGKWDVELDKVWLSQNDGYEVTHWMPLPSPPH